MEKLTYFVLGILVFHLCLILITSAQNGKYSEGMNSSETNKSCTKNSTDEACELSTTQEPNTTEITLDNDNSTVNATEFENSTLSMENVTETELTTEEEQTTQPPETTTEEVPTTIEAVTEARPVSSDICTCDLTMNSCDINCCCDVECSDKDRMAFLNCHVRSQPDYDPRHCYQTHFIYHNNTEVKLVKNPDGLFCIVKDNLPARFMYQNRKIVTTLPEFNKLHKKHKTFPWPTRTVSSPVFDSAKPFKAGEMMWTITNKTLVPFSLPVSATTSALCQASKIILYLNDWTEECAQVVPRGDIEACENNPAISASTFYSGFTLLSAPKMINNSLVELFKEGCPANICIPITIFLCSEVDGQMSLLEECVEVPDVQYPVFNSETGSCENVVTFLHYKIYHNGTDGITKAHIYIWLSSISMHRMFSQTFKISFHWSKDVNNTFHRSGNPGYIVGKPVMSGTKVTKVINIEEDIDKEAIELSEDAEDWLSMAMAMNNGQCDVGQKYGNLFRQSVTFGENRWTSCKIPINSLNFTSPTMCAAMFRTVMQLIVGNTMENVTAAKKFNLYIATFGDSKVEETGDWVQVMLESVPSYVVSSSLQRNDWSLICKSIITSIDIDIMFAHVGSLATPQAKILGAVFRFGSPHDIMFQCSSKHCVHDKNEEQYFNIESSVSFIDITKPALAEFAEPPVYEVKLPHDFFYPFFSCSSILYPSSTVFIFILLLNVITK